MQNIDLKFRLFEPAIFVKFLETIFIPCPRTFHRFARPFINEIPVFIVYLIFFDDKIWC